MNNNNFARGLHNILYFILAVINIILAATNTEGEHGFALGLVLYYVATILFLHIYCTKKRVSIKKHMIFSGILMLIMSWGAGFNMDDMSVYYIMAIVPLVSLMTYMEMNTYKIFLVIYFVQIIVSFFVPSDYFSRQCTNLAKISYFAISFLVAMILYYYLGVMQFREKYISEQEKSVDDLQKVIMAKCVEAKAATKSKSDFLSNMSHEIRTPLNAILGMNEMIMRENRDDTIAKYAGNVDRSGQMLLALINDVLDFSKIESGKLELVKSEYSFFSVAKDVATMLDTRFKKKELKLNIKIASDIPKKLLGDDVRIKQIITNIMTNAIKYTAQGHVDFEAWMEGDKANETRNLVISISDTGQGMSEENLKSLFDSFSRFNQKENKNIEGTGLGMAITKSLIDAMRGSIDVKSKLGEGSTFIVTIPQKVIDPSESGDFNQFNTREDEAKKRQDTKFVRPDASVLLVDDSRVNLAVAKGLLKYTKMQVTTANSGRECLDILKTKKFDIVLLDHMMPEMDGIETLKHIKEEHLCDETPVIVLTANAIGNAKEMYLSNGFDDYLSKPISGESLENTLKQWVKPKESE